MDTDVVNWQWWQFAAYALGWVCIWRAYFSLRKNVIKYMEEKEEEDSG